MRDFESFLESRREPGLRKISPLFLPKSPGASRDLEKIWTCFGTRSHLGRPATPHFDEHNVST
jgi:hypothetical protein